MDTPGSGVWAGSQPPDSAAPGDQEEVVGGGGGIWLGSQTRKWRGHKLQNLYPGICLVFLLFN